MRIVCISDTHGRHRDLEIPACDLLLHAGDITGRGEPFILRDFNTWLASLPATYKVVIAGNHDETLEKNRHWARNILSNATYLDREMVEIEGISIYGFPLTPRYGNWAFMEDRGPRMRRRLELDVARQNIDILLTHGPPRGILDKNREGLPCGCDDLLAILPKVMPKIHVFGHIHNGHGQLEKDGTRYINAAIMDDNYDVVNKPVLVEL